MGGPGIGRGAVAPSTPHDVAFEKTRVKGEITQGDILARIKISGSQLPGEANVKYEEMRLQYEQKAEDTIQNEIMPLEHKSLIRDYFAAIKQTEQESEEDE